MSGRSSRGGRGDGRAPWRRWCGGRLGADDRRGDLRAFLFDGAAGLEGLPGAAEGGEGELVEDDVGGGDDPPDGGDVDEVLGASRVVAEVDALETSGGEVVRATKFMANLNLWMLNGRSLKGPQRSDATRSPKWV